MIGCSRQSQPQVTEDQPQIDYQRVLAHARDRQSQDVKLSILRDAIQRFHVSRARLPRNLQELVASGFLREVPSLPPDRTYRYDPTFGSVWIVPVEQQATSATEGNAQRAPY